MGQLDLQRAFPRLRALPENFEDQSGPIEDLCLPGFFQIPLLHWRELPVDNDELRIGAFHQFRDGMHLAASQQRSRIGVGKDRGERFGYLEPDRDGKASRFFEPRLGLRREARSACEFAPRLFSSTCTTIARTRVSLIAHSCL